MPTADEFTRLLEWMESEGLVSSREKAAHSSGPTADSVAELAAKVQALDAITDAHRAGEGS